MFNEIGIDNKIMNDQTYAIIGACMRVHRELGCGFLEAVYQEALMHEFELSNIAYKREYQLDICYKGKVLTKQYYVDFICFDEIIVELKAMKSLETVHEAQLINYLKASNNRLGLLVNFGQTSLQQKRVLNKNYNL